MRLAFRRTKRTIVGIHLWVLWSLIVSSAFNLNQRLELNGSRSRCCRQAVKVETDDRHKYIDVHDTTVMVVECIPITALRSVFTRGIWSRQTRITSFSLPSFSLSTNGCPWGEETRSFYMPFVREMEALRDALVVGKGRAGKRKKAMMAMMKELFGLRWL